MKASRCIGILLCALLLCAACAPQSITDQPSAAEAENAQPEQAAAVNGNMAAETNESAGVSLEDNVATFEPCTVFENEWFTITVESFDPIGNDQGPVFHGVAKNTGDQAAKIYCRYATVNGITCNASVSGADGSFFNELNVGETQEFTICFPTQELEPCGVRYIEQCDFTLEILSLEGLFEEITENVSLRVENTTTIPAVEDIVPEGENTMQVLFDTDGIKITVLDVGEGEQLSNNCYLKWRVCLENNTTQNYVFRFFDASVEGVAGYAAFYVLGASYGIVGEGMEIRAGAKAYSYMEILTQDKSDADRSATSASLTLCVDDGSQYLRGNTVLEQSFEVVF